MNDKKNRFLYEHYSQPLLPTRSFRRRLAKHGSVAFTFLALSLFAGMIGYHLTADLNWIDSFLNASMILTGMGPVNPLHTTGAKIFSGLYALYSGIAFLSGVGILFAPVIHRVLHKFHLGQ